MASPLRFFVVGDDDPATAARARAGWTGVRATFDEAEQALSRFRESSDLTALNRQARRDVAGTSRTLVRALTVADRAHRRTGGRFDPRVLGDMERLGLHGAPLGGADSHPAALPTGRVLHRTGRTEMVRVDRPVDLGGIGKGLALRWAARRVALALEPVLTSGGGFLIDAGHDLVSRGSGPNGAWLVDIEDPAGARDSMAVIAVPPDGAVATSSIRLQRWILPDGRTAHHLIDPRTGRPGGEGLAAVTVAGRDPAWAEIWSKSLFLESATGIAAVARREGLAAWWATEDGRVEMTPAARPITAWLADEDGDG